MIINDTITKRVEAILLKEVYNKTTLADKLGISRPTLNTRLEKHNWKNGEIAIINIIHNESP